MDDPTKLQWEIPRDIERGYNEKLIELQEGQIRGKIINACSATLCSYLNSTLNDLRYDESKTYLSYLVKKMTILNDKALDG